jgi:protein-S-isoprenylcysteine O-methyltransferase Ste14
MRARAAKPAVQLVALAILVIGVGWSHMSGWKGPEKWVGLAGLTLYACWPLFEGASLAREAARPSTEQDAGTYFTYALARAVTVIVTVFTASSTGIPLWQTAAGVGLLAAGIALRTAAIRTLGDEYSNRVRWGSDSEVVSHGPYRWLRHPSYTGMLLGHLGLAVTLGSPIGAAALFVLFVPAIVKRIRVEERTLSSSADWSAFAASRSRLVPGLW